MRLDAVTAEIRPRSDWEAVDLGFALVRRDFWRCIVLWWLAMIPPMAIAAWFLWEHPLWFTFVFWWMKPAGSRMVLVELSRRLFGEQPAWRTIWKEIPRAWVRRFFYRYLWARFSPWFPVTLAVEDLEGLRGKSYRLRCAQVIRRGEGPMFWIYFLSHAAIFWFGAAILMTVAMFIPEGQDGAWQQAMDVWDVMDPFEMPLLVSRFIAACMMISISLTDIFVTGAGFGLYINNRTWIEGWDVELAFKRLAQRLGKVAVILLSFLVLSTTAKARDIPPEDAPVEDKWVPDTRPPAEAIKEVKAAKEFTVHTVTEKVPDNDPKWKLPGSGLLSGVAGLAEIFAVSVVVLLVGAVVWMIWRNRHAFRMGRIGTMKGDHVPSVRVVMGMEVSPDTLPRDIPAAAWALWQQGRHQEALGLLYRGAISRVMELGRLEIQESDTEGDCVRRVESAGPSLHPDYFRGITGMWIRLAYAGIRPGDSEIQALCQQWPFGSGSSTGKGGSP